MIDITRLEDEKNLRICMKLVICLMFKGQQAANQPLTQFESDQEAALSYRSIFQEAGVRDDAEVRQIMSQFQDLVRKLHNFEIGQIH